MSDILPEPSLNDTADEAPAHAELTSPGSRTGGDRRHTIDNIALHTGFAVVDGARHQPARFAEQGGGDVVRLIEVDFALARRRRGSDGFGR